MLMQMIDLLYRASQKGEGILHYFKDAFSWCNITLWFGLEKREPCLFVLRSASLGAFSLAGFFCANTQRVAHIFVTDHP